MPRKSRLYVQGLPQLIQLVGHNHIDIFMDDDDYQFFLECVDKALEKYHCQLHAYTLKPQELFFLLTPQTKADLSRFIQHIGCGYAHYYNHKYQRTGTLWESRYRSCLIEPAAYFLLVQQFIEMHSVSTQLSYKWSSYSHHTGREFLPRITPHAEYLALGKDDKQRAIQYRYFLQTPFNASLFEKIHLCLQQSCVLGTSQFCQKIEAIVQHSVRPRKTGRPRKYFYNHVSDWVWLEQRASKLLARYCYDEIRLPLLEDRNMIEHEVDFMSKQNTKNVLCHDHATLLRYEGTTGLLRSLSQHQNLQNTTKLWYLGEMFRRSNGQFCEHVEEYHQLGVESFGYENSDIELEQFMLQYDMFKAWQIDAYVELQINTVGTMQEFASYRKALHDYYAPFKLFFEQEEWHEWLQYTPEKLLNAPGFAFNTLKEKAPSLIAYLSTKSLARFESLIDSLRKLNIPYSLAPALFPSNNYCHTIFEWHSDALKNTSLVCRGGRYDDSASTLLKMPVHAYGFAFMLESVMELIKITHDRLSENRLTDIVIIPKSYDAHEMTFYVGQKLRQTFPLLSITTDFSSMKLDVCQQNAKRLGSRFLLLVSSNDTELIEFVDLEKEKEKRKHAKLNEVISLIISHLNL